MIKKHFIFLPILALLLPHAAFAGSFVEFNPKTAVFVPPGQTKTQAGEKPLPSKPSPAVKALGAPALNEAYIKNLVVQSVNEILNQHPLINSQPAAEPQEEKDEQPLPYFVPAPVIPYVPLIAGTNDDGESSLELTSFSAEELSADTASVGSINVGALTSDSGAYLSDGGDWVNASSRDLKENFATVSPQTILEKIASLPIYSWNYKLQNASSTHIGPVAQDFYSAFSLGNSSTSISTIDPAGVALAGIQGLDAKLKSILDFSWAIEAFKKIGIEIADGIIKIKALIADSIQTHELEIGSSEKPAGFTIYDRATNQPLCVFAENGILKTENGKCGAQTPPPIALPEPASQEHPLTDAENAGNPPMENTNPPAANSSTENQENLKDHEQAPPQADKAEAAEVEQSNH